MEGQAPQPQQVQQNTELSPSIKTPKRRRAGKKGKKILIIVLAAIFLGGGGVGAWYLLQEPDATEEATDNAELTTPEFQEPTEKPTPTIKSVNKEEVKIQVLNGTGVPGEAGLLKGKLEGLGYIEIVAENAQEQDYSKTQATFSKSLSKDVVDEVTEELEDVYKEVTTKTSSTLEEFDIEIITGIRKDFIPSPTKAPATPTPTGSVTGTVTPTVTKTPTPTL